MQMFEAHFHAIEPNRLQRWSHRRDIDVPQVWTDEMNKLIIQTINPAIIELYEAWQACRKIGDLWAGLRALHWHLIQSKGIHTTTATHSFIWSFSSNPLDLENGSAVEFGYPESSMPKTIYGLEGGPNPFRCTFRDVAIHTGIIEKLDNMSFHCASKGFSVAAADTIYENENQGLDP